MFASPLDLSEKTGSISDRFLDNKEMQAVNIKIIKRIRGWGRGSVFTPNMFLNLGSRAAVDKVLSRLSKKGAIRRLSRGLYDLPKKHPVMGELFPSPEAIAKAISERDSIKILPSGAYAANLLGLSTQVPAQIVFLTDGASRTIKIQGYTIKFRRTTPKNMAVAGRISGLVIQALKHIGKDHIDQSVLETLKNKLSDSDKEQLSKDLVFAPAWIGEIIKNITQELK
ncbi:MAG: DUF6088 family protein [bacterium]